MTDTCVSPLFLHLWAETRTRQHVSVAQAAPANLRTFALSPKRLETLYSTVLLVLHQLSIRSHSSGAFAECSVVKIHEIQEVPIDIVT